MTRSFSSFAIFFTVAYVAIALFYTSVFFRLGAAMYNLPSVKTWTLCGYLINLTWSVIILKYHHDKNYRVAFRTLTVSIAVSLIHFCLFYDLLATREVSISYIIATLLVPVTGIVYASSLIFSSACERQWLRTAGVLLALLGILMLTSFIWAIVSVSARVNGTAETFEQWISLLSSLIPMLFILNFLSETKIPDRTSQVQVVTLDDILRFAGVLSLLAALIFLPRFFVESFRSPDHPDNISAYAKRVANPFEARTFVNNQGDSLWYRFMTPLNYDSTRQYPLVVCLHGSSAVGSDNVRQVAATLPALMLSTPENREKYPAFLFVPQCPRGFGWGGLEQHPSVDSLVFEALEELEKEFSVDAKRRYVSGYSMGGYGAWHFIATRPEMFAAAVPICGGGDPQFARNVVDVPVWAFHGAKDINVPVKYTRDMVDGIREAGGNPRYTEFPDAAHNIWNEVAETRELPEWLFAQRRD